MDIIQTPAYQKAFIRYLRKGTPIDLSLKAEHPTTHYIWRTTGDDKVRPSHAANDGKVFSTEKPPETGNPGEDYNCRCWAEPINGEYAEQALIQAASDNPKKWTDYDLTLHYRTGKGQGVTLARIGYLGDVIRHYANSAIASDGEAGVYRAINGQIIKRAKEVEQGAITYSFNNTYDFQDEVLFTLGKSTISGEFNGDVRGEKEFLVVSGIISYQFRDAYTDPASFVENLVDIFGISREDAEQRVGNSGDVFGAPYPITDEWKTKFNATVIKPEE